MKKYYLLLAFFLINTGAIAQRIDSLKNAKSTDSLFNTMNVDNKNENAIIFESPRLILTQTTETIKKKNLNFIIIHRFGDFAGKMGGGQYFYGLDDIADVYIGFQYGLTNDLNIQIGRNTIPSPGGMADLQLKYAILHQTNDGSSPIAISLVGGTAVRLYNTYPSFSDRVSYLGQVILARKFSHTFSFEIAPSIVQNNQPIPNVGGNPGELFSLSAAARLKVTKLMSVVVDYAHPFSSFRNTSEFSDPFGFGIQAVTGGHVFTLNITNSRASSEINYLSNTTSDYARGQFRIGFTISRMFDFNAKQGYKPKR
ncbi:MAG TPA: DUF5777 family beta-barrel protein [Mucilaginibacter sp.]|jgi:hypothetical protein